LKSLETDSQPSNLNLNKYYIGFLKRQVFEKIISFFSLDLIEQNNKIFKDFLPLSKAFFFLKKNNSIKILWQGSPEEKGFFGA